MKNLFDDIPPPVPAKKPEPRDPPAPDPPGDPTVEAHQRIDRLAVVADELRLDLPAVPAKHRESVRRRAVSVLTRLVEDLEE